MHTCRQSARAYLSTPVPDLCSQTASRANHAALYAFITAMPSSSAAQPASQSPSSVAQPVPWSHISGGPCHCSVTGGCAHEQERGSPYCFWCQPDHAPAGTCACPCQACDPEDVGWTSSDEDNAATECNSMPTAQPRAVDGDAHDLASPTGWTPSNQPSNTSPDT